MWWEIIQSNFESKLVKNELKLRVCPYCGNDRWNLEINIENGLYHCWVCDAGGMAISFAKDQGLSTKNFPYKKDAQPKSEKSTQSAPTIQLPKEAVPLKLVDKKESIYMNKAKKYLSNRGIDYLDYELYSIHVCLSGKYANRVLITLYDNGRLVSYSCRTFVGDSPKYLNANSSKSFLSVFPGKSKSLVLVEGVFDAIALNKINWTVAPILGSMPNKYFLQRIEKSSYNTIVICLDSDRFLEPITLYKKLQQIGKNPLFCSIPDDPASLYVTNRESLQDTLLNSIRQPIPLSKMLEKGLAQS